MKKQITYALLLITAVIATQSISANYSNRYGKNGAGQQRIIGGQGGRQLAPQVGSEGLGRYNLQQGRVEGEMSTMPVYGNPRRTNGGMSTMPVNGQGQRGRVVQTSTAIGGNDNNQVGYSYIPYNQ